MKVLGKMSFFWRRITILQRWPMDQMNVVMNMKTDDNLSVDSKVYQKEISCVDVGNVGLQICSYICNPTSIHLTALQSLKIQNSSNSNKIGSCCHEVWHQSRIWHLFKRMALSFFGQQIDWFFDKIIFFFLVKTIL